MEINNIITNNYAIISKKFGDVDISSDFFDSFRESYSPYYEKWIELKKDDPVFVVEEDKDILGFLKVKIEGSSENYNDIKPSFNPARRLKICSFKVRKRHYAIGVKLIDLAISQAMFNNIGEIYGTLPKKSSYKYDLVNFLKKRGFIRYGTKNSHGVEEEVYVMPLTSKGRTISKKTHTRTLDKIQSAARKRRASLLERRKLRRRAATMRKGIKSPATEGEVTERGKVMA